MYYILSLCVVDAIVISIINIFTKLKNNTFFIIYIEHILNLYQKELKIKN